MATAGPRRTVQVRVKPNARVSQLNPCEDGTWLALIKSPPVDGKANAELVLLVAAAFACRRSAVTIRSGASGRMKLVDIDGA
ncbi:hypothetical protein GN316_16205 [Xylophilus sp. Kf1]|nr:hypothetical protein [Xylophilus sp. Kf1]